MKVIFLDIDGPLITGDLYYQDYMCSEYRTLVNKTALNYVLKLSELTGAMIVTNTMHNEKIINGRTIKDDLIKWGVPENKFHNSWRTIFPKVDYTGASSRRGIGRLIGINHWLETNGPDHKWVCFDDRNFTDDKRLVLINFNKGVGKEEFEKGLKLLS